MSGAKPHRGPDDEGYLLADTRRGWAQPFGGGDTARDLRLEQYTGRKLDPSDPEANANAVFKGYTVIRGNQFHKDEWQRIRAVGILKPAGQVTPSPKPCLPDGSRPPILAPDHWTADMRFVAEYARRVARYTIEREITVECVRDHSWHVNATFGPAGVLTLNVGALGARFFARRLSAELDELLVHEFGHVHGDHHKLEDYHDRLCEIAGRLAQGIRTSQITMGGWEDQGGSC